MPQIFFKNACVNLLRFECQSTCYEKAVMMLQMWHQYLRLRLAKRRFVQIHSLRELLKETQKSKISPEKKIWLKKSQEKFCTPYNYKKKTIITSDKRNDNLKKPM